MQDVSEVFVKYELIVTIFSKQFKDSKPQFENIMSLQIVVVTVGTWGRWCLTIKGLFFKRARVHDYKRVKVKG